MNTIRVTQRDKVAIVTLDRGRSNALNAEMCSELNTIFRAIEQDDQVLGVILTGKENFFSAGLDLIELYDYNEVQIKDFWSSFLELTRMLVMFRKPFVAAINGHAPAGGCVLAICSDYRIMVDGKYIIGLNEVPVGIIVPESIFQLYAFWIGSGRASRFLLEGKLMKPEEALQAGLVDELVPEGTILTSAERQMKKYIQLNAVTWQQSKINIRRELVEKISADQSAMLDIMLRQWWSPNTRSILQTIIGNLRQKAPGS
ncbi:enoyl-CoA hydratase/isomerase family protein [Hufsiella ginkgonis]|uniref:Enoyl-CoA hydratase/isomerase family protein n=1 Tax=Hufsiella ginkgonis TaxID=2695274 RepID=A0A7K1Y4C6_9SPHI|nr:enoyl-CoA hydratase/isomerase family protein [Hufsiella ginkgonis]MXV17566.1 enoyl-CoA hydratase/isomerase family protein [Hufsiella ginkgonis]